MEKFTHSVHHHSSKCVACTDCTRICPTKAIRVKDEKAVANVELCIDCGSCIRACRHHAVTAVTSSFADHTAYKYTAAIPSPTLYTQFGLNMDPNRIIEGLKTIGFDAVYDETWMIEMVTTAIDTSLSESSGPWPKISTQCPAVLRLIQIRYPDLIQHLVNIETPRELAAKDLRKIKVQELGLKKEEIGIFHITQCSSAMISINRPIGLKKSYIDGAIPIAEIYPKLLKAINDLPTIESDVHFSVVGLKSAAATGEMIGLRNENVLNIHGVESVIEALDRIESGKFRSIDYLDMYICPDGCVGGPLNIVSRYDAQRALALIVKQAQKQNKAKEEQIRNLFRERYFSFEDEISTKPIKPLGSNLKEAIAKVKEKQEIIAKLPGKNCAACGAPDCETLADDIIKKDAKISDCVFIRLGEHKIKKSNNDPVALANE